MLKLSHYPRFFSLDFAYKTYTVEVPSPLLVKTPCGTFLAIALFNHAKLVRFEGSAEAGTYGGYEFVEAWAR
jgi:hypothetical protein